MSLDYRSDGNDQSCNVEDSTRICVFFYSLPQIKWLSIRVVAGKEALDGGEKEAFVQEWVDDATLFLVDLDESDRLGPCDFQQRILKSAWMMASH